MIAEKISVSSRASFAKLQSQKKAALFCFFSTNLYTHQKILFDECFVGFNPVCSD